MPQSTRERLNALHFTPKPRERSHLHCWPKDSQLHHPPLQQQVTVTSTHKHFSCYNPMQNQVFKTTTFSRAFSKQVSQAQLRSQAPAWEKQGSKRRHEVHKHVRAIGNAKGEPFKAASPTQELILPAREIKGC